MLKVRSEATLPGHVGRGGQTVVVKQVALGTRLVRKEVTYSKVVIAPVVSVRNYLRGMHAILITIRK